MPQGIYPVPLTYGALLFSKLFNQFTMFSRTARYLAPMRTFTAYKSNPAIRPQHGRTCARFSSSKQEPQSAPEGSINNSTKPSADPSQRCSCSPSSHTR
ncbi:hypothetical protein F5Y13DRAFT_67911 [Hypoxylon sp. FL1857]|nr:hypothetical protein F5Y13DRAFT_67911 [Hypoxylon sp. FL1857]